MISLEPEKQLSAWRKAWDSLDVLHQAFERDDHGTLKDHAVRMFGQVTNPKDLQDIGTQKFSQSVGALFTHGNALLEKLAVMICYSTLNEEYGHEFFDARTAATLHKEKNIYTGLVTQFVPSHAVYQQRPSADFIEQLDRSYHAEPDLVGIPFKKLKLHVSAHIAQTVSAYGDMAVQCAEQAKLALGFDTINATFQRSATFAPAVKKERVQQARLFKKLFEESYVVAHALAKTCVNNPMPATYLN